MHLRNQWKIAEIRFTQFNESIESYFKHSNYRRLKWTTGLWDKIPRAHGGCLGMGSRRRARQAAISPGEAQTAFDPGIPEWGNPGGVMPTCPGAEHIGPGEATGGTETSKYPEERKSTETPGVAASETGLSPNPRVPRARGRCRAGVAGHGSRGPRSPGRSHKPSGKRNGMGRPAAAGESPVRGPLKAP